MFTVSQAAKALGVTRQRVHQLIAAQRIDAERVGHVWIVHTLRIKAGRVTGRPAKK